MKSVIFNIFFTFFSTRYTSLPQGEGGRPMYPVN